MTVLHRFLTFAFCVGLSSAAAAESSALDKVKTGILPSGGYYSLYEGTCPDRHVVTVASLDRSRRWCINASGTLACARGSQEAVEMACARAGLASTGDPEGPEPTRQ